MSQLGAKNAWKWWVSIVVLAATIAVMVLILTSSTADARHETSALKMQTTFRYEENAATTVDPFWVERQTRPRTGRVIIEGQGEFLRRFVADGSRRCQVFVVVRGYRLAGIHVKYIRSSVDGGKLVAIKITSRKARVCYYPSLWRAGLWQEITLRWEKRHK